MTPEQFKTLLEKLDSINGDINQGLMIIFIAILLGIVLSGWK